MPAEAGVAAAEEAANGRNFPMAGSVVPGAPRVGSGRHNNSSSHQQQQQHRGFVSSSSASFGRASLLQEMRALQEKLEADIHHLEGKIHEMETDYLAAPAEVGNMIKGWEGYVSDNDVVQPAPAPVSSSSWGNSSGNTTVLHASSSGQRHGGAAGGGGGGGGGSSVVRAGKRSHTKSSHGKGSSRKSTAKTHSALCEPKCEGRGDYIDEHGRGDRSAASTASDNRCV